MNWIDLAATCAPTVSGLTIQKIIQVESAGNPIAINVNGIRLRANPKTASEAAAVARKYIAQGQTVDLGLMQINSSNLTRLGFKIEEMFEPCKNLKAGGAILTESYHLARKKHAPQMALRVALSAYNTGSFTRGFVNGYVAQYIGRDQASKSIRYIRGRKNTRLNLGMSKTVPNPYTAPTVVFSRSTQLFKGD